MSSEWNKCNIHKVLCEDHHCPKCEDIKEQKAAHEKGEACDMEDCQECCEHDDLDHGICMCCESDLNDEICNRAHEISKGMER